MLSIQRKENIEYRESKERHSSGLRTEPNEIVTVEAATDSDLGTRHFFHLSHLPLNSEVP